MAPFHIFFKAAVIPPMHLWVNPDCGLEAHGWLRWRIIRTKQLASE
jgi:methionine synthase II (cobalamin-independent)